MSGGLISVQVPCVGCLICSPPFSVLVVSFLFVISLARWLVPSRVSAPLTLSDMASSLPLTVESLFCPSSCHFLDWLHWCSCYLGVFVGGVNLGSSYSAIFLKVKSCSILLIYTALKIFWSWFVINARTLLFFCVPPKQLARCLAYSGYIIPQIFS